MKDDPLDIDALHVIVDDLQTCASMIKDAWLEDREDQIGYLADRLLEHVAELRRVSRSHPKVLSKTGMSCHVAD